eukprot:31089-Pelagococcus_subviridis.AAC.5
MKFPSAIAQTTSAAVSDFNRFDAAASVRARSKKSTKKAGKNPPPLRYHRACANAKRMATCARSNPNENASLENVSIDTNFQFTVHSNGHPTTTCTPTNAPTATHAVETRSWPTSRTRNGGRNNSAFIFTDAATDNATAAATKRLDCASQIATHATSEQTPSLNIRSANTECIRFETHSSDNAHGGTTRALTVTAIAAA